MGRRVSNPRRREGDGLYYYYILILVFYGRVILLLKMLISIVWHRPSIHDVPRLFHQQLSCIYEKLVTACRFFVM